MSCFARVTGELFAEDPSLRPPRKLNSQTRKSRRPPGRSHSEFLLGWCLEDSLEPCQWRTLYGPREGRPKPGWRESRGPRRPTSFWRRVECLCRPPRKKQRHPRQTKPLSEHGFQDGPATFARKLRTRKGLTS